MYINNIPLLNGIKTRKCYVGRKTSTEIRQADWRRPQKYSNKPTHRKKTTGATTDMSNCKYCHQNIFWKQSAKSGKWYAVDQEADNTSFHSKTCTGLER